MKKHLIRFLSAALTAGGIIPFVTLPASAAAAEPHTSRLSYEDCVFMAEYLGKDVDEILALRDDWTGPSKYIAYVSAKNNTYSSGTVTFSMQYNTTYLTYTGSTSGSNGTITGTDNDQILSSPWWNLEGSASLHTSAYNDRSNLIFSHDFDVVPGEEYVVKYDAMHGPYSSYDNLSLSSAYINGSLVSSIEYSTYFESGFRPLGDVDGWYDLTLNDAQCILDHITKTTTFTETWQYAVADFNRDGHVDVADASAIVTYLSGSST